MVARPWSGLDCVSWAVSNWGGDYRLVRRLWLGSRIYILEFDWQEPLLWMGQGKLLKGGLLSLLGDGHDQVRGPHSVLILV